MRRAGNRSRVGVATLLFLLCLGPLLTAAHELAASHRFCVEHQAIEEGPGGERPPEAASKEDTSRTRAASREETASHQGCPLAQALAAKVNTAGSPASSEAPQTAKRSSSPPAVSSALPLAVLIIAPKTSPPV